MTEMTEITETVEVGAAAKAAKPRRETLTEIPTILSTSGTPGRGGKPKPDLSQATRQAYRRGTADIRQEQWSGLSNKEKLATLDTRLGKGVGAKKQRARIQAAIDKGAERQAAKVQVAKAKKAVKK